MNEDNLPVTDDIKIEGDAKPIENPEGFCPTAAEMSKDIPCVTCVPS